jgi:hypothetical protein
MDMFRARATRAGECSRAAKIGFSDTARVVDKADRNDLCVADREGHE